MHLLLLFVAVAAAHPNGYGTAAPSKQAAFIKLVTEGPADGEYRQTGDRDPNCEDDERTHHTNISREGHNLVTEGTQFGDARDTNW